jgi:ectoine hydroxylase-related dioxygenase (phytanoyl-CoA dioxygenase family)
MNFKEQGLVYLKNYLSEDEAACLVQWADELDVVPEFPGKWMIYHETSSQRARIENFVQYMSMISNFVDNKITPLIEQLCGEPMILFKDKMNWKLAGGKGFLPHQDQPAWSEFNVKKFYTVAVFGNPTTIANGCLEFDISRHFTEVCPYNKDGDGSLTEEYTWTPLETTTRDIVVFDSYIPHRSGPNNTNNNRRVYYFTYTCAKDGSYHKDYVARKREIFPPDAERDPNKQYNHVGNPYNLANPIV